MKEAITSPYNRIVFRETFNSEQSVRNNGNIPMLKVYEGILDLETITQIWSLTKGKAQ